MDFRALIAELDKLNEGDADLNAAPKINNVSYSAPGTDVYNQPNHPSTGSEQNQPTQDNQQKELLIKQLYDIATKLQQLNQHASETGQYEQFGNIQASLLESFGILTEGPAADQRSQLIAQAQNIIKSLKSFTPDNRIQDAISTVERAMKAPAAPTNMYPIDQNKIKRFQALMAKTKTTTSAPTAPQSTTTTPTVTKPDSGGSAQASGATKYTTNDVDNWTITNPGSKVEITDKNQKLEILNNPDEYSMDIKPKSSATAPVPTPVSEPTAEPTAEPAPASDAIPPIDDTTRQQFKQGLELMNRKVGRSK